jgi:glycosyltransferase involved in cell wall biosynthesis
MNYYIVNETSIFGTQFNAGSKARDDIREIFKKMGAKVVNFECDYDKYERKHDPVTKLWYHFEKAIMWKKLLKKMDHPDMVVFQFPIKAHSLFLYQILRYYRSKNIKTVAVVHDLDCLRNSLVFGGSIGKRITYEEVFCIKEFDKIIIHNEKMRKLLTDKYNVDPNKMVSLEIFDYLMTDFKASEQAGEGTIIAGNLEQPKAGYIYELPENVHFDLYGVGYEDEHKDNIVYHGSFLPDELPRHLNGKYGLVWDGPKAETCEGIFGNYLKYNNPHKTSLYLACGIPVIVWAKAAIADFVRENKCGIVVDDLAELSEKIDNVSESEYLQLKKNAEKIGEGLRQGYNTKRAFDKCLEKCS